MFMFIVTTIFYNDAHLETIARDHPPFLPTHTPRLFFILEDSPCSFSACGNLRLNLEGWLALFSFCTPTINNKRRCGKGIGGGEGVEIVTLSRMWLCDLEACKFLDSGKVTSVTRRAGVTGATIVAVRPLAR